MTLARILPATAICLLSACGNGDHADLKQFVAESGQNMTPRVDPLPQVKPYEPFPYEAESLPDPFKPRKIELPKGAGGGLQPDFNRPKQPLEAYPLESLKMVGTLTQKKVFYALVKTPDNNLYRVKPGNYMGQNFGLITEITESATAVKELVQDGSGDWSERISSLQLLEEQEQKK